MEASTEWLWGRRPYFHLDMSGGPDLEVVDSRLDVIGARAVEDDVFTFRGDDFDGDNGRLLGLAVVVVGVPQVQHDQWVPAGRSVQT